MRQAAPIQPGRLSAAKRSTMICNKCNGTGTIPGFSHVNNGRCFKCNGSGQVAEPRRGTITYARIFVNTYARAGHDVSDVSMGGDGFFPEVVAKCGEVQYAFGRYIGHATAEHRVVYYDGHYYVGQPICRSSTWYRVPEDVWEEFIVHYNKANAKFSQLH